MAAKKRLPEGPTEERRPRDRRLSDVGTDGEALLEAVLADPGDDRPRLVYADHLQQRGDPRGEFIAVQCAHAKLPEGDPAAEALAQRSEELLGKHQRAWVEPFMGDRHTTVMLSGRKFTRTSPTKWDFHRGFVRTATVSAGSFPALSEGLFAREPVQRVRLTNRGLEEVLKAPGLERLRELDLTRIRLKDAAIALFASRRFESLEVLELEKCGLGVKGARAMANAPPQHWPKFRHLGLADCALQDGAMRELARAPFLSQVHSLDLRNNTFGVAGWSAFISSPFLERLEVLQLNWSTVGQEGARALAASKARLTLRELELRLTELGDDGLAELTRADFGALRVLRLLNNELTDRALPLLRPGWLDRLEVLDLSGNELSPASVAALKKRFGARLVV